VVSGIDLRVRAGEIVAVVGPNGAGKSTLLKAITGELAAMSGRVRLGDSDLTSLPANRRVSRGLGYVPQVKDVFETLTVEENLNMGGYLLPREQLADRRREALAVFPELQPMHKRVAGRLSGGERKMVAIARTLMLAPTVLILDEPSANLAPALVSRILGGLLRRLADTGMGVLVVEQKAIEAMQVADFTYVLVDGRVRIAGPSAEVLNTPDLRAVFLGAEITAADR
jgi:branched-chain amino acid transport system ATP-binding protein